MPVRGSANVARGAANLIADAIKTSKACGAGGQMVLRADSAYYNHDVIAGARRHRACFWVTARKDCDVTTSRAGIGEGR
jgi:hypothetical protein